MKIASSIADQAGYPVILFSIEIGTLQGKTVPLQE